MAKKIKPREPSETGPMLTHVRHQFELIALAQHLRETKPDEGVYESRLRDSVIRVAGLTALRSVIDFFKDEPGSFGTNMIASDYASEWDRKSAGVARPLKDLADTHIRINERVSHTDVQRHRTKAPMATELTIRKNVDKLLRAFAERLDEQWRGCFYPSLEVAWDMIRAADPQGPPVHLPLRADGTVMPREMWPQENDR